MGAWDNAPEPEGPEANFVSLKDGDTFVGQVQSVELITIPAGTLPNQPKDLEDIPKVMYLGVDGRTWEFKYTTAVLRNGILRLRPEVGTWVYHHRIGKSPGKTYVDAVVREAHPEEYNRTSGPAPAPQAQAPAAPAAEAPAAGPVQDDAPPF